MSEDTLAQTIEIVSAYVANHNIRPEEVPAFIAATHAAVLALDAPEAPVASESTQEEFTPAVTARKSLGSREFIISMIDGKPYKTLRRHLSTHGLTPEEYRQRYKLKSDYPMVAPSYSETRRSLAHSIGLGRKAKEVASAVVEGAKALVGAGENTPPTPTPKRGGRKAASASTATPAAKPRGRPKRGSEQQQAAEPQPAPERDLFAGGPSEAESALTTSERAPE